MISKQSVLALVFAAALPAAAFAQASLTGTILGTVTDPTGASVANADVTVTNIATNEAVRHKSDNVGNYFSPNLRPGTYSVSVEHSGFKRFSRNQIPLKVSPL